MTGTQLACLTLADVLVWLPLHVCTCAYNSYSALDTTIKIGRSTDPILRASQDSSCDSGRYYLFYNTPLLNYSTAACASDYANFYAQAGGTESGKAMSSCFRAIARKACGRCHALECVGSRVIGPLLTHHLTVSLFIR